MNRFLPKNGLSLMMMCFGMAIAIGANAALAQETPKDVARDVPNEREARETVERALAYLDADMVRWRDEHGCAACHHGPMYVWTLNVARRQGYRVNEPALRETTDWLLTDDARILPKRTPADGPSATLGKVTAAGPNSRTDVALSNAAALKARRADRMAAAMMGRRQFSQATLYLALSFGSLQPDDPARNEGWTRLTEHLVESQGEDGSFQGRAGRPPIFNTPQSLTTLAAIGLHHAAESSGEDHEVSIPPSVRRSLDGVRGRSERWLAAQPAVTTHQELVQELWRATLATSSNTAEIDERRDGLLRLQRPDGGWSQTSDGTSDAFATGQTLYVLRFAGLGELNDAVRRAIGFLVRTQAGDGSWPMKSRPDPESGKPASDLSPITYAAAAWSTLGISAHVRGGRP